MGREYVVELSRVRVAYGEFEALREVTLQMPAGSTALVGRNGAGKSTLLRLLLGLVRATAGDGHVLGTPLAAPGVQLRRAVGFMPEGDCIVPGMTGHDHVALAGELCGLSARQARRRAHEVLAYVDLGEARYRKAEQFSAGMKQRLKLAIALVADPALLLLDEPTIGLDPPGRTRMLELIADLARRRGKSIVLSTHLLADVEQTCDRLVALEAGKVAVQGPLETVLNSDIRRYRLQWPESADAARLRSALSSVGVDCRNGEIGGWEVVVPPAFDIRNIFAVARDCGTTLLAIEPMQEDIASLYARLIGKPRSMANSAWR